VLTERVVIVSDVGRQSLIGMDRRDGRIHWSVGRRGSGPGEFRTGMLRQHSDTSAVVYDPGLRRVTRLSQAGALFDEQSVAKTGHLLGLCDLAPDTSLVFVTPSGTHGFAGLARLPRTSDTLIERQEL